jgi:hypothetical protein
VVAGRIEKALKGKMGSFYWKNRFFLVFVLGFSLASALYHGVRLSPGWLFWDSASQWGWAYSLQEGFGTDLREFGITSQWPLFNTFLKVLCLKLGIGPSVFAVIQSLLMQLSVFYVLTAFSSLGWYSVTAGVLVCLSPFVINYGVFHSADTPAAILLLFMTAFSVRFLRRNRMRDLYLASSLFSLSLLFRYNFISLAPLLFFIPLRMLLLRSAGTVRAWVAVLLPLSAVISILGTQVFTVYPMDTAFHGILMRNLSFLREKENDCIRNSIRGVFHDEKNIFSDRCYRTVLCKEIYTNIKKEGSTREQLKCFFDFARREPGIWIRNTLVFTGNFLGVQAPMDQGAIEEIRDNTPSTNDSYRMVFDPVRMEYWSKLEDFTKGFGGFLGRPFILLMVSLVFSIISAVRRRDFAPTAFWVAGLLYYSVFIVDGPDCVFRYYFPAFMCFLMSTLIAFGMLFNPRRS